MQAPSAETNSTFVVKRVIGVVAWVLMFVDRAPMCLETRVGEHQLETTTKLEVVAAASSVTVREEVVAGLARWVEGC